MRGINETWQLGRLPGGGDIQGMFRGCMEARAFQAEETAVQSPGGQEESG